MRGHVFGNQDGSILIISIKGTSAGLWGGGPTGEKDKMNDNTLFSCCCAYVSRAWTPVCNCFQGNDYICETFCLQNSIADNALYYDQVMVKYRYSHFCFVLKANDIYSKVPRKSTKMLQTSLMLLKFGLPAIHLAVHWQA